MEKETIKSKVRDALTKGEFFKETSLSEKKVEMFASKEGSLVKGFDAYFEEDVKEAVRKLKEELVHDCWKEGEKTCPICQMQRNKIDKIFGKELSSHKRRKS